MPILDMVTDILGDEDGPAAVLHDLRSRVVLSQLFTEAARKSGNDIVDAATEHDNGFEKIVLATSGLGDFKLVLHAWKAFDKPATDNIHDHRWNFASVVLCGKLQFELYEPSDEGASYPLLEYRSPEGSDAYKLEHSGDLTVSKTAEVTMPAGTTYQWSADLLHRAWGVSAPLSATLIVQGPAVKSNTSVLLRAPAPVAGDQTVKHLSIEKVRSTLRQLLTNDLDAAWSDYP